MKKTIIISTLLLTFLFISQISFGQVKTRWYPFKKKIGNIGLNDGGESTVYFQDSTLFFSPSLSIELFTRESVSGAYKVGAIPGIGYGIKFNPWKWKNSYLIGLDLFAQANLSDELPNHPGFDYFNIDILPVITIFNWIGVGYGPRFKVGLDGVPSTNRSIFSFGIRKSF